MIAYKDHYKDYLVLVLFFPENSGICFNFGKILVAKSYSTFFMDSFEKVF